jgi:biopolymer transport protein ExbD
VAFGGGGAGVRSDINITPLVDVVLVLLIIFMVMTPTLLKEMNVVVPEKADVQVAQPSANSDQIVISVNAASKIAINREPILEAQLIERMRELMASREQKLVFFDIDDDANYGEVMHVMDLCRGAGAKTLGIMTR